MAAIVCAPTDDGVFTFNAAIDTIVTCGLASVAAVPDAIPVAVVMGVVVVVAALAAFKLAVCAGWLDTLMLAVSLVVAVLPA